MFPPKSPQAHPLETPLELGDPSCPIIVLLLLLIQHLSTDKWPCHMGAPLVRTIHGANLIIHTMSLHPFGPLAIPNQNIRRCPRGQRTNPNDVAQAVNGNRNFVYAQGVFRIKQDIAKHASYGCNGHAIHVVCHEIWKVWDVVPLQQSFRPSNFSDNTIQVRTNTMHTCPPLHSRGSPTKGGQNQKSKPPLGVTMMPLGAPSISKYGSLVRPDTQIVALRTHCA